MSTVTPVTVGPPPNGRDQDSERDHSADQPKVGSRVLGHLRLDQLLERTNAWTLYLADDEERSELVLVVLALSEEALSHCLSGPATGDVVKRTTYQSFRLAEVVLNETHLQRFGEKLLERPPVENPTLESSSAKEGPLLPGGTVFASRYRIEGVLGRGGMGEVYRAYDETFQRAVALKIVRVDAAANDAEHREEAKRRLLHEARVVSALNHPHIVEIYDAGENDGLPYLVLELCDGGNLRKAMSGDVSQSERVRWLTEIAEALAYAHEQGIIHRDVKPENVILTADRRAKVTDFGIAKALKSDEGGKSTLFGIIGTPRYMAPEQLLGNIVDGRADQYAWALVASELLTNSHPRVRVVGEHASGATSRANTPPHLRRVLARALETDPAARYLDFRALLASMQHRGRHAKLSVGFAVLALLIIAGATLTSWRKPTATSLSASSSTSSSVPTSPSFDAERVDADMVHRCAPAAQIAFSTGLQLWRDASQREAVSKFDEATRLDPECAPASLYYLIAGTHTYERRRELFRMARDKRVRLNDREKQLLEAVEPTIADRPDFEEFYRRTAVVAARLPGDPDARRINARALFRLERFDDALAEIDQSATLHAKPIPGDQCLAAYIQIARRDYTAALQRFDACIEASPDSADCLLGKGELLASQGQCRGAEVTFRRLTAAIPQGELGHFRLANVVLASTHDAAAARGLFEERWRRHSAMTYGPDLTSELARIADEYRMAVVDGDLDTALQLVRKWNDGVKASNNGRFRGDPLLELIQLLRELGLVDEARTLARQGLRAQRSWTADDQLDVGIELARAAYITGGLRIDEYRSFRSEWSKQRPDYTPADTWLAAFAGLPDVSADMTAPIAAGEYAADWTMMSAELFSRAATELVRLGRLSDALQHADAAEGACNVFSPMGYLHAQAVAATTHDAAGDVTGACKRYSELRNKLQASPRSATLRLATQRMNSLGCKGLP